jgi:hypothetical protein
MKLYYFSSLVSALLITSSALVAQNTASTTNALKKSPNEVGILLGISNYAGDIVKEGNYDWGASCFNVGAYYRLYSSNNLSWRFSLNQGRLKGDDLDWPGTDRIGRGFNFATSLTEVAARTEFDFFNHQRLNSEGFRKRFSVYVYAGAGLSFINPQTNFNNRLGASFSKLIAEDKENHRNVVFTIPFGGGVKFDLNERWILGGEFGLNPVFNDYLDGISMSANPRYNDWYSIGGLTLSYRLRGVE